MHVVRSVCSVRKTGTFTRERHFSFRQNNVVGDDSTTAVCLRILAFPPGNVSNFRTFRVRRSLGFPGGDRPKNIRRTILYANIRIVANRK